MKGMKKFTKVTALSLVVFMFVLVLGIQSAEALATLRLSDGTTTFDVADGSGLDSNSAAGAVTYVGAVGSVWWLNVTTGITYPALGGSGSPQMDLSDVSMTNSGPSTLTISFSQDNFSLASSSAEFVSTVGGATDGTANFDTYFDNGNNLFAQTIAVGTLGPYVAGTPDSPFSGATNASGSTDSQYSITQVATITHNASGENSSFNYVVNVVPEPISSTLFIIGGATLGFRRWRKKKIS